MVGEYAANITLHASGATVALQLTVRIGLGPNGKVSPDGGMGDIYKLGRLKWLDSTRGIDENVTDGFGPMLISMTSSLSTPTPVPTSASQSSSTPLTRITQGLKGSEKEILVGADGFIQQVVAHHTKERMGASVETSCAVLSSPVHFTLIDGKTRQPIALTATKSSPTVVKHTDATVAMLPSSQVGAPQ